jgi:hypothetical protein
MSDLEPNQSDGLPSADWYQPEPQPPAGQMLPPYGNQYGGYPGQSWSHAPLVNKPTSNLAYAILVTLFCCLPFGIVAIVYAAQVDSKWNAGDWRGAERASRSAKNWALVGLVSGLIFSIIYALIVVSSAKGSVRRY